MAGNIIAMPAGPSIDLLVMLVIMAALAAVGIFALLAKRDQDKLDRQWRLDHPEDYYDWDNGSAEERTKNP